MRVLLGRGYRRDYAAAPDVEPPSPGERRLAVEIPAGDVTLQGDLDIPSGATGIVVFAHGSGSGRHSPRNRFVAETLTEARLGTLLIDLLSLEEERVDLQTAEHRFDIPLLARRVVAATDWLRASPAMRDLKIGLFGASTGAAAALVAAAERSDVISAVVSRGGRPDLAGHALPNVRAPVLLIVGGLDTPVIGMNQSAMEALPGVRELRIVPGATHLFEEPGALEEVAAIARDWFERYLGS